MLLSELDQLNMLIHHFVIELIHSRLKLQISCISHHRRFSIFDLDRSDIDGNYALTLNLTTEICHRETCAELSNDKGLK